MNLSLSSIMSAFAAIICLTAMPTVDAASFCLPAMTTAVAASEDDNYSKNYIDDYYTAGLDDHLIDSAGRYFNTKVSKGSTGSALGDVYCSGSGSKGEKGAKGAKGGDIVC